MPSLRLSRSAALAVALAILAPAPAVAQAVAAPAAPAAARLSARDLARLRWIAGDWRGTGVDGTTQAPFFERYRFADDSTLLVESFSDSTWGTLTETSRWELRGGRLTNAGTGAKWVAVALDDRSVDFAPLARARNGFQWARARTEGKAPAEWRATISWTDAKGARQQRFYRMERVR